MSHFWKKLKSNTGETLVETIVSTLLIAFTITVLAMLISFADKLNQSAMDMKRTIENDSTILTDSTGTESSLTFKDDLNVDGFEQTHLIPCKQYQFSRFRIFTLDE